MKHPVSVEVLSPQVAKICAPDAPEGLRDMAAGGLAPLGPNDLITALYVLTYDPKLALAKKAEATLLGLPANVLEGALNQLTQEVVLDGLARLLSGKRKAMETILLNQNLAAQSAHWIAGNIKDQNLLEIIAANEQRLLASPSIVEALYNNPSTRMSTADRVVEFAVRNGQELTGIACFQEVKAAIQGELIPEPTEEPTPDDLMFAENFKKGASEDVDEQRVAEALDAKGEGAEVDTEEGKVVESLEKSLSMMTISAKIRAATLGSGTQRAILIRDANKLVAMAVVKSPGIKESEVMQYSRYRSLPEEAIRYMATNREWTKHYGVKLNLVQNPRCPLEIALRFLNFLRVNDVRSLERDRNIPQAVANAARQLRNKRMK